MSILKVMLNLPKYSKPTTSCVIYNQKYTTIKIIHSILAQRVTPKQKINRKMMISIIAVNIFTRKWKIEVMKTLGNIRKRGRRNKSRRSISRKKNNSKLRKKNKEERSKNKSRLPKWRSSQGIQFGKEPTTTWTMSKEKSNAWKNRKSSRIYFLRDLNYLN